MPTYEFICPTCWTRFDVFASMADHERGIDPKCPKCGVLWTFKGRICEECGYEKPIRNEVQAVPGELLELQASNARLEVGKQEFYSQILYYARAKGFKEGWAAYKYKEKFGVFPRGLHLVAKPPTEATMNWIKSRAIAFAKSKARTK